MTEAVDFKKFSQDLASIKDDLQFIKEHMVDIDTLLSAEDKAVLEEARKEFVAKKTISLDDLQKKLKL